MTRQWLAVPEKMCLDHLLQEHAATHALMGDMEESVSLDEKAKDGMFFGAAYVKNRHDLLSVLVGGHGSPMETPSEEMKERYPLIIPTMESLEKSLNELFSNCRECYSNHMGTSEV